jgi:hypothetical protein
MTVRILVEGRNIAFTLNSQSWRWHAPTELKDGNFPLFTEMMGKRFELYADGTFAEVER